MHLVPKTKGPVHDILGTQAHFVPKRHRHEASIEEDQ